MTTVLLLGASGQVGRQVNSEAVKHPDLDLVAASRSSADPMRRFDLDDPPTISHLIERISPDVTILAAARTNVAWCQANERISSRLNVRSVEVAATATARVGARLCFLSTDYVFD